MKVADIMTRKVVTVSPELSVFELAALLVRHRISAAPVIAPDGRIIGIVSESDLLRRPETGTERARSYWPEAFSSPDFLAERYISSRGLAVKQIMSRNVATIRAAAPLADAATVMELQRVKRLPVTENGTLVGIISRADLVRALAAAAPEPGGAEDDNLIRARIEDELEKRVWSKASRVRVMVVDHVVHLYGIAESDKIKEAVELLARQDPGARTINSHLTVRHLDAIGR